MKPFLQWMRHRDVSGTAKGKHFFFVCCALVRLFSNCFASRMTFAHSVWASALLDGDEPEEDTRMGGVPVNLRRWIRFVCLASNRHLELVSPVSETHSSSRRTTLFHTDTRRVVTSHSLEEKFNHWDLLPFLLPFSCPFCCYLAVGWRILRWRSLLVAQRMHSALMKRAGCYWSASFSRRGSSEQFSVCGWKTSQTPIQTVPAVQNVPLIGTRWGTILSN